MIAQFEHYFMETWHQQKGPILAEAPAAPLASPNGMMVQAIDGAPDNGQPLIYRTLLAAVALSRASIHLTTGFFVPTLDLKQALKAAAKRGVDVQVIVPGRSTSNAAVAAGRSEYEELLQSGVKLHEFQKQILHAKIAVIDGAWSAVGSSNLDWRSTVWNNEIDAIILSTEFGKNMEALFQTDLSSSKGELCRRMGDDGFEKGGVSRRVEACLNSRRSRYAMTSSSTVVSFRQPDEIDDPLTAVLRSGARRLLAQAIEAEAEAFLAEMKGERLADGRERVVRHGHGPERLVQTGIGPVEVQRVKLRDRAAGEAGAGRISFTSAILPRWARRTRSLDALLPVLYLRGVSMGDFQDALGALLGRDAPNLSPSVVARLRGEWEADYCRWQGRDLSARRYVYVWADGIYLQARMEPQAECMLVLIGATPEGKKELVGFQVGVRESAQSWRELLVDLRARGLVIAPELATGDGALGFWKALDAVSPTTRHQRCTVHKTVNVLDKLPKSVQPAAKADLREAWTAPDRATAEAAIVTFAEKYGAKYEKAVTCLIKDRHALLTFYDSVRVKVVAALAS